MKMHVLSGGRLRMRKSIFFPNADRSELIEMPVSAFLIRHPQGNVLFDTGCHPSVADRAAERWGGLAKVMTPIAKAEDNVVESLAALSLTPDDVDAVIASHLHPDHCGCNAFFKRATILCHAKEVAAAKDPDSAKLGYVKNDWATEQPFDEIGGPRDVYGDGRIVVIPLPGHTPGTAGALVGLDESGTFLLASDALAMMDFLPGEVLPRNTWNMEEFTKSLAEIRHIEKSGATVICGHDDAQWKTLKKGVDAYE